MPRELMMKELNSFFKRLGFKKQGKCWILKFKPWGYLCFELEKSRVDNDLIYLYYGVYYGDNINFVNKHYDWHVFGEYYQFLRYYAPKQLIDIHLSLYEDVVSNIENKIIPMLHRLFSANDFIVLINELNNNSVAHPQRKTIKELETFIKQNS